MISWYFTTLSNFKCYLYKVLNLSIYKNVPSEFIEKAYSVCKPLAGKLGIGGYRLINL